MSNDPKNDAAEAAEALAPEPRTFTAGGKQYSVTPMRSKQLWPVLRAGLPIFDGLVRLAGLKPAEAAGSPLGGSNTPAGQPAGASSMQTLLGPEISFVLELLAEHGERLEAIVAVAIGETVGKVGDFEPQELYTAVRVVTEVNRDFFTTKVLPMLGAAQTVPAVAAVLRGAEKRISGAGPTPSSN